MALERRNDCVFIALSRVLPHEKEFLRNICDAYMGENGVLGGVGLIGLELEEAGKVTLENYPIIVPGNIEGEQQVDNVEGQIVDMIAGLGYATIRVQRLYESSAISHIETFKAEDLETDDGRFKLRHIAKSVVNSQGNFIKVVPTGSIDNQ